MVRSYTSVMVALLYLSAAGIATAGSRTTASATATSRAKTAPAPPATTAAPAAAATPAPTSASPPPGAPAASSTPPAAAPVPGSGGALEPPPAGAKADQIADYAAALFKQQRYSDAGDALKLAYEREARPIFLFNVGQTYRKAGRYADAVAAYRRFIAAAPSNPLVSEARGYENTLTALIEQQERANQIETSLIDQQAEAERARQNLTLQQRKTEEAQSALAVEKAQQKKIYRRPWFWGVIGGGVGLVVAIGLGIGVSQLSYHTQGGTLTFTPVTP